MSNQKGNSKYIVHILEYIPFEQNFHIDGILKCIKSRGLWNSLTFLHRLHNVVRKAQITLERPGEIDVFEDSEFFEDEDAPVIELMELPMDKDQIEELRRYGIWSKEANPIGGDTWIL